MLHIPSPELSKKPFILVVDDIAENLQVVGSLLRVRGYDVAIAQSGLQALQALERDIPDLILLDIQMPEMNGFDVCKIVKQNPKTAEIPIIFLTAQSDTEAIVEGFALGAIDYIVKPFNAPELLARVQTHVELQRSKSIILAKNSHLELLNEGLQILNGEKNVLMSIAAHDLQSPLTAIRGLAEFLQDDTSISPERARDMLGNIVHSADRMFLLIKNLLNVSALEEGRLKPSLEEIDPCALLYRVAHECLHRAQKKNIMIEQPDCRQIHLRVVADTLLLEQVFDNILTNAIKYSPAHTTVRLRIKKVENEVICEIQDEGSGFTLEDKKRLFTKFTPLSAKPTGNESSTGLGLYIVKRFVDAMQGRIWCESETGKGSIFIVALRCL